MYQVGKKKVYEDLESKSSKKYIIMLAAYIDQNKGCH